MPGQYTSIAFAETLVLENIAASIGSIGDAYDYVGGENNWTIQDRSHRSWQPDPDRSVAR